MLKQIIYAASGYVELRRENGYFVDKTEYIAKLERIKNPIFLRPVVLANHSFALCCIIIMIYDIRIILMNSFDDSFLKTFFKVPKAG